MNKMKYQAGGAVDSTDDISAEKLKKLMQQQKDAEMDANMQEGMSNYQAAKKKKKPVGYAKGGKVRGCGIARKGYGKAGSRGR
jgi:hypothetical protein